MTREEDVEQWHRRFGELLQEIRVAQTGTQILFAFLLTMPFYPRFGEISGTERAVYIFTLVAATVAMALLIGPVSYHREVFGQGRKPELVRAASAMARAGLFVMLLAVTGAVYLVLDMVAGIGWALGLGAAIAALYVVLWYVIPKIGRFNERL